MFVRTQRLTLRPGWPEDAAALTQAIGHENVVRNLSRAPWPYPVEAAETFLASFDNPVDTKFLVFEHRDGATRLIGGTGLSEWKDEPNELGYWYTPDAWGRGFATEAGRAVLHAARALGIRRVTAGHFIDNPASGRVLRKLGFRPTGKLATIYSRGRGCEATTARYEIDLSEGDCSGGGDEDHRMAA
ncbi:RimJ/RimL family protein N-acetyltransferase [Sphingomonas kyeonggiensis]|uniref:GNAT family N-acetyltransferase n=1 Tax=Sphingomonas kyeonggiensis TaxID=1268553 RepID=UPI002785B35D|nr:GNAT family N-acetyltransferase [Sphingomonas kyeonggiensis]MDQ0252583.1 RimJ/RimL family protein N-acetyltransferase [Sphingomonas kyeonggiensis]